MAGRGKPVCKYFLEGKCKFGDNCRYRHPTGDIGYNDRGWKSSGNSRSSYGQSTPHSGGFGKGWGGQKHQGNRFQLFSERNDTDSQDFGHRGGGSRDSSQRGNPFDRLGTKVDRNQDRWNGGGYDRRNQGRWNDGQNRGGWNGNRDEWNGNRGGWSGNKSGWSGNRGRDTWNNHQSGYDSHNRRDGGSYQQIADQPSSPKEVAQSIQEDMKEWSASGMWPLSCYAYWKETPCVPGLMDVSPEELRWEACQANSSGTSANYLENLNKLGTKQTTMQRQLCSVTIDDARSLLSLLSSSQSDNSGGLFGPSSSPTLFNKPSLFSSSEPTASSLFGPSSSGPTVTSMFGGRESQPQSLFGSVGTSQSVMDSAGRASTAPTTNSATLLQQSNPQIAIRSISTGTTPSAQPTVTSTTQASSSGVSGTGKKTLRDTVNYVQTRELTKLEIEAFCADKFILGKIPEHAPLGN